MEKASWSSIWPQVFSGRRHAAANQLILVALCVAKCFQETECFHWIFATTSSWRCFFFVKKLLKRRESDILTRKCQVSPSRTSVGSYGRRVKWMPCLGWKMDLFRLPKPPVIASQVEPRPEVRIVRDKVTQVLQWLHVCLVPQSPRKLRYDGYIPI